MISRRRLRKFVAPAAGFRQAAGAAVGGFVCVLLGVSMSFREALGAFMGRVSATAEGMMGFLDPAGQEMARYLLGGALLVLGVWLLAQAFRYAVRQLFRTVTDMKGGVADRYRRRLQLAEGPRIVALGGGTGLSTILRGLKQHSSNITAIVTVTDDGGSSGRLSQEIGMIPPGDIRNCLVALADAEKSMTDLFQHRFTRESGSLSGHSLGNLLLAALADQAGGDFEEAIEIASNVLAIRGQVLPSTLNHVSLSAVLEDDQQASGETNIVASGKRIRRVYLEPRDAVAHESALEAIAEADLICIGPGSVYTSVIPNLLVPGIAQALADSPAKKVYVCNVMTQKGESDAFSASEHATAILANVDHRVFDYVMVNTGVPSPSVIERYRGANQFLVDADIDRLRAMGLKVIAGDFMNESDLVRHDPMRVAYGLVKLLERRR